jgi:hypothetical protein
MTFLWLSIRPSRDRNSVYARVNNSYDWPLLKSVFKQIRGHEGFIVLLKGKDSPVHLSASNQDRMVRSPNL